MKPKHTLNGENENILINVKESALFKEVGIFIS